MQILSSQRNYRRAGFKNNCSRWNHQSQWRTHHDNIWHLSSLQNWPIFRPWTFVSPSYPGSHSSCGCSSAIGSCWISLFVISLLFYGTKLLIRRCRYHNINKKMRIKVEKSSCWLGNVWYGLHFLFFISFSNNGFSRAYMDFAFQVDLL